MTRVIVLGATGMLGMMLVDVLSRQSEFTVVATARNSTLLTQAAIAIPDVSWLPLEATDEALTMIVDGSDWVINAIGLIKPYVRDDIMSDVEQAIQVNALFPHRLARASAAVGARLLQIATDCVYSGRRGHYREDDVHDPEDVYGKTKSLGEVDASHVVNIRCSIVGPELRGHRSLLDWFRGQAKGATVGGFTNHRWNGVTTLQFAEVAAAIIRGAPSAHSSQHLVPADEVTKSDLLRIFAQAFDRNDLTVVDRPAPEAVDRTLATQDPVANCRLWAAAGYEEPPSIASMTQRLARFDSRLLGIGQSLSA